MGPLFSTSDEEGVALNFQEELFFFFLPNICSWSVVAHRLPRLRGGDVLHFRATVVGDLDSTHPKQPGELQELMTETILEFWSGNNPVFSHDQLRNRRWTHLGKTIIRLSQWAERLTWRQKKVEEAQCPILPSVPGANGCLQVCLMGTDPRMWRCVKPLLPATEWQRTVTQPQSHPECTSTRTYLIPECRCTAPGCVRSSAAPSSKDASTTFWRGRLAGNASRITSLCECFLFLKSSGSSGYLTENILIKQGDDSSQSLVTKTS